MDGVAERKQRSQKTIISPDVSLRPLERALAQAGHAGLHDRYTCPLA